MYYPPNPLRTGSGKRVSEADAIDYVTRSIFDVVGSVFSFNCGNYQVDEQSESTHSVTLSLNGSLVEHISRVDKSWSVAYGQNSTKFAILEFKRPGALQRDEWYTDNGVVKGRAAKICKQLKKYCTAYNTRYAAVCDGFNLVELYLEGDPTSWVSSVPGGAPSTRARIRWIQTVWEMKRHWFLFLQQALDEKIRSLTQVNLVYS
jgi:hypothetical protein